MNVITEEEYAEEYASKKMCETFTAMADNAPHTSDVLAWKTRTQWYSLNSSLKQQ